MPYSIAVAGGTVYRVDTAGVATALTLPTGVSIDTTRMARMTVFGRNVVIVNAPSRSLWVDPNGMIRPLLLQPPSGPPILAAGAAGGLTGTFNGKYSHIVKDPLTLALLMESDFSQVSANVTIAAKLLAYSAVYPSPDTSVVTARRLYRPTTGPGSTYYNWIDLDGNTLTSGSDDLSDTLLPLLAAPTELGSAPGMINGTYMTLIASWKQRLWTVGDQAIDTLRYSGNGIMYGWPAGYGFDINPIGSDQYGITGLMPRRDELGIARRNHLWKVTGAGTAASPFGVSIVYSGKGCFAPDSVVIIADIAYFLGEDGVYTWGPGGVNCVSDGKTRAWFATDTYFNRSQYLNAFGKYNPRYHTYELHLAAAGSSNIDRWVSLDIASGDWFGPHKTSATTPSCGGVFIDSNGQTVPIMGGTNGTIYQQNQAGFSDDGSAIVYNWLSKFHDANTPAIRKAWGMLTYLSKAQSLIGTCRFDVRAGELTSGITQAISVDNRTGRHILPRLGRGQFVQLELTDETNAQGHESYGYEVPSFELGQRS